MNIWTLSVVLFIIGAAFVFSMRTSFHHKVRRLASFSLEKPASPAKATVAWAPGFCRSSRLSADNAKALSAKKQVASGLPAHIVASRLGYSSVSGMRKAFSKYGLGTV